jgi:hypothetical protein
MKEKVFEIINEARRRGVIQQYAIGGAIGAMFYMEPFATKDLDVFTFLPVTEQGIVSLSAIYDFFGQLGCQPEGQYLIIEGERVEFIPPTTPLVSEAIEKAVDAKFGQTQTRVFRPEHLAAIMLQTGRRIDLARLERFTEQVEMNQRYFKDLLRRHKLMRKWQTFLKQSST